MIVKEKGNKIFFYVLQTHCLYSANVTLMCSYKIKETNATLNNTLMAKHGGGSNRLYYSAKYMASLENLLEFFNQDNTKYLGRNTTEVFNENGSITRALS